MKIDISLSASGIAKAASELRKYAESLQPKSEKLIRKLGEKGVEYANLHLIHDDTGATRESIQYVQEGLAGTLSAGGAAVWIEFGTGVIANAGNSPHPKRDEAGMVAWGEYGEGQGKGEWYFYSHYFGWTKTKGIPMNPFMYSAAQDMRNDLVDTAREVFKDD